MQNLEALRVTKHIRIALATAVFVVGSLTIFGNDAEASSRSTKTTTSTNITFLDDEEQEVSQARLSEIFEGASLPSSIAELSGMQDHFADLAQQIIPAVVGVRVGQSQGSGVIISKDGYVLTAGHVVGAANQPVVFIMPDGTELEGTTLGANFGIDSGLMRIETEGDYPYVDMGSSSDLTNGQWVMAIGHPGGYEHGRTPVVRIGRILANSANAIRTDCALVGGDSGGPLFDMQGNVVGINSRIGSQLSSNIHVPVNTYAETWDRLVAAEEWGPLRRSNAESPLPAGAPYIGVVRDEEAENARIAEVREDGPASEAGMEVGDVIVQFDGRSIDSFESLRVAVLSTQPGDEVEVVVMRDEMNVTMQLTIGTRE